MLTDEKLPPLPSPEKVLVRLTAMQHIEAERFTLDQMREYGRAVEQAAYAAAIKACENTQDYGLIAQVMKRDCADAIRRLTEQPK